MNQYVIYWKVKDVSHCFDPGTDRALFFSNLDNFREILCDAPSRYMALFYYDQGLRCRVVRPCERLCEAPPIGEQLVACVFKICTQREQR